MKIITNDFLLCIADDKEQMQSLIAHGTESKDLAKVDFERKLEAGSAFYKTLKIEAFIKLWNDANEKDHKLLTQIALTINYVREYQSVRSKISDQIKMCDDFLASDMCNRNTQLYFFVSIESLKLKSINHGNLMPKTLKAFDLLLERTYPEMSIRKRYVELSILMNALGIYTNENKPFLTIEMARKLDTKSKPEDIIIDRIKKILKQFD
jgi:hypothetical protein